MCNVLYYSPNTGPRGIFVVKYMSRIGLEVVGKEKVIRNKISSAVY